MSRTKRKHPGLPDLLIPPIRTSRKWKQKQLQKARKREVAVALQETANAGEMEFNVGTHCLLLMDERIVMTQLSHAAAQHLCEAAFHKDMLEHQPHYHSHHAKQQEAHLTKAELNQTAAALIFQKIKQMESVLKPFKTQPIQWGRPY